MIATPRVDSRRLERHAETRCELAHEGEIRLGSVAAESVMHVADPDSLADSDQPVQQRHRICAPRHRDEHAVAAAHGEAAQGSRYALVEPGHGLRLAGEFSDGGAPPFRSEIRSPAPKTPGGRSAPQARFTRRP